MTNEKLDPALEGQWRLMLLHQYRRRVLLRLDTSFFDVPSWSWSSSRRSSKTS